MSGAVAAVSNGAIPMRRNSQPIGLSGLARAIKRPHGAADRPMAVLVIRKLDHSVSRSRSKSQRADNGYSREKDGEPEECVRQHREPLRHALMIPPGSPGD